MDWFTLLTDFLMRVYSNSKDFIWFQNSTVDDGLVTTFGVLRTEHELVKNLDVFYLEMVQFNKRATE
jgi:hypothetical protein